MGRGTVKTTTDYIRDHLCDTLGVPLQPRRLPALEVLCQTEWSAEFEQLMRNRLVMGAFRYERMAEKGGKHYDCLGSIRARLDRYEATGNLEHLVDIANLCMIEFLYSDHPKRHWAAADDGDHHTQQRACP